MRVSDIHALSRFTVISFSSHQPYDRALPPPYARGRRRPEFRGLAQSFPAGVKGAAPGRSGPESSQTLPQTQHDPTGSLSRETSAKTPPALPPGWLRRLGEGPSGAPPSAPSLPLTSTLRLRRFPGAQAPPRCRRRRAGLLTAWRVTRFSLRVAQCLGGLPGGGLDRIGPPARPPRPSERVVAGGGDRQGFVWRRQGTAAPGAGSAQMGSAAGRPPGLWFQSVVSCGLVSCKDETDVCDLS